MLTQIVFVAMVLIGIGLLLNLWSLLRGPSMPDRLLALDTMYINSICLLYTSPSPRDGLLSRMPSSA